MSIDKIRTHFQRFELKYWLTEEEHYDFREAIAAYMEHDPYCEKRPHHAYPVWSLYLDTADFDCFQERCDGLKFRQKYRLRTYAADKNFEDAQADHLFVEIKKRQNRVILKDRAMIHLKDAGPLLDAAPEPAAWSSLPASQKKTLERFLFFQNRLGLEPQIAVKYEREAYFGSVDKNVRINFDRNLCSKTCRNLAEMFTESKDWLHFRNPRVILEIKVYNTLPTWLVDLIRRHQLKSESISKYCDSAEMVIRGLAVHS